MINNKEILDYYNSKRFELEQFLAGIKIFFEKNPKLNEKDFPVIHSIKSRFKDPEHLIEKILRKQEEERNINKENLLQEINDLIGIRVLYLYQDQFEIIHKEIIDMVDIKKEWQFVERPKAYTWDPESKEYYEKFDIDTEVRTTYYTSVHYVIKPNNDCNPVSCEIQVRTLFEEIWGEIDHHINYPHKTDSVACKEQLRVLSKLVSTGTRLADSIFRSYNESNILEKSNSRI